MHHEQGPVFRDNKGVITVKKHQGGAKHNEPRSSQSLTRWLEEGEGLGEGLGEGEGLGRCRYK